MIDVLITVIAILALILIWVALCDSNRFVIKEYAATDGRIRKPCRAVFLTDLHNKCYGKDNRVLLEAIDAQAPDFILTAGDLLTAKPNASMEPALALLGELAKKYPIYYADGNHEHRLKLYPDIYGDMAERYERALGERKIERLVNSHVSLREYGIAIFGCEIDRHYYKRFSTARMEPDYMPGILGQAPGEAYTVLLAHNPDYFPQYAAWGADLTLAGHVHGGVARVPFWGKGVLAPSCRLFPRYDGGVFREGDAAMVLSRGLGMHTVPVRVFNPAELWVISFQPGADRS